MKVSIKTLNYDDFERLLLIVVITNSFEEMRKTGLAGVRQGLRRSSAGALRPPPPVAAARQGASAVAVGPGAAFRGRDRVPDAGKVMFNSGAAGGAAGAWARRRAGEDCSLVAGRWFAVDEFACCPGPLRGKKSPARLDLAGAG